MRQEWACEWEGLQIRVVNWRRGLRTGEELYVNDNQIDSNESWIRGGKQAFLAAQINVHGLLRHIEVFIGQPVAFRTRCGIFMDGQRIGGDMAEGPVAMTPSEWTQTQSRGIVRFVFTKGILFYGLIFATLMTIGNVCSAHLGSGDSLPFAGEVGLFVFDAVLFGGSIGYLDWRSLKKCFEGAESKLEGPPRFTI